MAAEVAEHVVDLCAGVALAGFGHDEGRVVQRLLEDVANLLEYTVNESLLGGDKPLLLVGVTKECCKDLPESSPDHPGTEVRECP